MHILLNVDRTISQSSEFGRWASIYSFCSVKAALSTGTSSEFSTHGYWCSHLLMAMLDRDWLDICELKVSINELIGQFHWIVLDLHFVSSIKLLISLYTEIKSNHPIREAVKCDPARDQPEGEPATNQSWRETWAEWWTRAQMTVKPAINSAQDQSSQLLNPLEPVSSDQETQVATTTRFSNSLANCETCFDEDSDVQWSRRPLQCQSSSCLRLIERPQEEAIVLREEARSWAAMRRSGSRYYLRYSKRKSESAEHLERQTSLNRRKQAYWRKSLPQSSSKRTA